jgi:hypothetical protein
MLVVAINRQVVMRPAIIMQQVTRSLKVMTLPKGGPGATWMKCSSTWETTRRRRTDRSHVIIRLFGSAAQVLKDR